MNGLDIGIVVVAAVLVVYGAVRGIVRLVLGSIALVAGVFLGCWYNAPVASWLAGWIGNESLRRLAALALVLLATIAAFAILVWFVTKTLEAVQLRWIDRLSGAALGFALGVVLIAALLVPLTAFLPAESRLVGDSTLSPWVLKVSTVIRSMVPEELKRRYDVARERMKSAGRDLLPGGAGAPASPGAGVATRKTTPAAPPDPNAKAAPPR